MNKTVAAEFSYPTSLDAGYAARTPNGAPATASSQSLYDLPPGESRESLLAVQQTLSSSPRSAEFSIYEAGGGSMSFLPLAILRRAHVAVVDIDQDQLRNNDYAQQEILGDVQTHRFPPGSFDLATALVRAGFRLPVGESAGLESPRDPAPSHNERLTFGGRAAIFRNRRHAATAAMTAGIAMPSGLNAFFANSVNSPAMSMVNFSCCFGSAPGSGAGGLIRGMAPQPRRAAVRMEAGAHACL